MVGVAQLVEPRIVIPVVVGSSPIIHPIFILVSPNLQYFLADFLVGFFMRADKTQGPDT